MWGTGPGWQEGGQEWEAVAPLGRTIGQHLRRLHVAFPEAQHTLLQERVTRLRVRSAHDTVRRSILYKSKQEFGTRHPQGTGKSLVGRLSGDPAQSREKGHMGDLTHITWRGSFPGGA